MQKEKHKQNFKIRYQNDETVCQIGQSISEKTPQDKSIAFTLDNAHLAKRNRLHYKAKDLQKIIFRYKVQKIITNFIRKLRLNSVYRTPIQQNKPFQGTQNSNNLNFLEYMKHFFGKLSLKQGLSIGNIGLITWSLINIVQITIMVFIFCIMMAFPETQSFSVFLYFRSFSIGLYAIDMILNFSVKRYKSGKHLQKIGQISQDYIRNGFIADLISILIFPIDVLLDTKSNITILISLVALIKLFNNIKKFQKFEYLMINSFGKEHYFGLVKVFLTNFAIGHFLSILLNLMAGMNQTINWHIKAGISDSDWFVKYVWGYYWGTNIMLTVGFGDICASNYYEAIVLVFIQTFSCITLAYNINYVGALISSIRQSQQQKKRKLKIFHRMCQENFVDNTMQSKIANFMEEQFRIKQSFQHDVHDQVLKSLPKTLQKQFRKQANKTLFDNIGFLNNLSKKSLLNLAEVISRRICHPQQIVLNKGNVFNFMILQKGSLSFTCKIRSILDGNQIQTIDIKQGEKPKILSLNFIKNKITNFNVKSNGYSVLYELSREQIMDSLKNSQMDYQMLCQLKDKYESSIEQNNLYPCSICKVQFHNKFQCSRLHFIPLRMKIQIKHVFKDNKLRQSRFQHFKRQKKYVSSCLLYSQIKIDQRRFIQDNFDEEQFKQIQNLFQFYNNKPEELSTANYKSTNLFFSEIVQSTKKHHFLDDKALGRLEQILQNRASKLCSIWELQMDSAENFNFYFRQGNPEQLKRNKKSKRNKNLFFELRK